VEQALNRSGTIDSTWRVIHQPAFSRYRMRNTAIPIHRYKETPGVLPQQSVDHDRRTVLAEGSSVRVLSQDRACLPGGDE
jgi:hypothetical protein